jgi:hypothetical protein
VKFNVENVVSERDVYCGKSRRKETFPMYTSWNNCIHVMIESPGCSEYKLTHVTELLIGTDVT